MGNIRKSIYATLIILAVSSCGTMQQKVNERVYWATKKAIGEMPLPAQLIKYDTLKIFEPRPKPTQLQLIAAIKPAWDALNTGFYQPQLTKIAGSVSTLTVSVSTLTKSIASLTSDAAIRSKNSEKLLSVLTKTMASNEAYKKQISNLSKENVEIKRGYSISTDSQTKSINNLATIIATIALILGIPQVILWYKQRKGDNRQKILEETFASFLQTHSNSQL